MIKSYVDEFNGTLPTCEKTYSNRCALIKAMKKEREMKDWFVLYHSTYGSLAFLYDVFTEFRNVLRLEGSLDEKVRMHSLRALDGFFKNIANVEQFVNKVSPDGLTVRNLDQNNNYRDGGLSTNIFLFGYPAREDEATFHYFSQNMSDTPPIAERLLANLLTEFRIFDTQKYFNLLEKYFGENVGQEEDTRKKADNNLLQIFINPAVIDDIVYISKDFGVGMYKSFEEQNKHLSPSKFLKEIRENPKKADDKLKDIGLSLNTIQARLFMKPERLCRICFIVYSFWFLRGSPPCF